MRLAAHLSLEAMLSHVQAGEAVVLGLMSGSSLDGLDLCLARFGYGPTRPWSYQILKSRTIPYDEALQERLRRAPMAARQELLDLDVDLGRRWANEINRLLQDTPPSGPHDAPCLVASHGHTIDHRPERGTTYQIGNPAWLHALTGLPVVHDFRSADVALGGQGAPLVPMGDALLFGDYNACLNLGGIANLSWEEQGLRKAFDIAFCNTALNRFAQRAGLSMDRDGVLSQKGRLIPELLSAWDAAPWYQQTGARSLDTATFEEQFEPPTQQQAYLPEDLCYTWCVHWAGVTAKALDACNESSHNNGRGRVLVSGGGAAHPMLLRCLSERTTMEIVIAEPELRDFKEALVFGLLGLLHQLGLPNVLGSGTGCPYNHRSGSRLG